MTVDNRTKITLKILGGIIAISVALMDVLPRLLDFMSSREAESVVCQSVRTRW